MNEELSYPCQHVIGDGQLCGLPCEPGFVRCLEHRQAVPRREIVKMLEHRQDTVLLRVESALDSAISELIRLATNAVSEGDRIRAIDKLLTLGGFANVKIDAEVGVTLNPDERDRVLVEMIKAYASNPDKIHELEAKLNVIDTTAADS